MAELAEDTALYERMEANLGACWARFADSLPGAALHRLSGVLVAVFTEGPERVFYNNAVLARDLDAGAVEESVDSVEHVYGAAGVDRYALWAHESETASIAALEERGYRIDTTTRAMAMALDDAGVAEPTLATREADWEEYVRVLELLGAPNGTLKDAGGAGLHARIAALDGETVAAALAFDHDGDCGIYNVGTMPQSRRLGFGTALTAAQLHAARERGCTTASLQSTPIAEGVYASLGFRDLGRFVEYVR